MDDIVISERIKTKFGERISFKEKDQYNSEKIICFCNKHKYNFSIRLDYIFKEKCKDACPLCHGTVNTTETINEKLFEKFGGNITLVTPWSINKKLSEKAIFNCKKHGNFETTAMFITRYTHACPKCHRESVNEDRRQASIKKLRDILTPLNITFKDSEFIGVNTPLDFYSIDNTFLFRKTPGKILYSTTPSSECSPIIISTGEEFIKNFLEENKILYEREKKFDNLKYKNNLRYDFYISSLNILIEFNGSQHYDNNSKYYDSEQILRDSLKEKYANDNGFRFLKILKENNNRITLKDSKFLKEEISNFINSSTTSKTIFIK